MHFLLPFWWISRRLLILNEKKGVFIFSMLSCVCCTCSKRYRHRKRKYKLWTLEESSFCPWAFFGVSGEIKSVTAHISERKEQKHNDVISSRRFHYLQQVNCAGECKGVVSQCSSKKSLRKQTLVWGWLWNNWPGKCHLFTFPYLHSHQCHFPGCMFTVTSTYTDTKHGQIECSNYSLPAAKTEVLTARTSFFSLWSHSASYLDYRWEFV